MTRILLLAMMVASSFGAQQTTKISELTTRTPNRSNAVVPYEEGGTTYKATVATLTGDKSSTNHTHALTNLSGSLAATQLPILAGTNTVLTTNAGIVSINATVSAADISGKVDTRGGTTTNITIKGLSTRSDQSDYTLDVLTSATSISASWSNAPSKKLVLAHNATITFTDLPSSGSAEREIRISTTNTSTFTLSFANVDSWRGGSAPVLPASKLSIYTFTWNGSGIVGSMDTEPIPFDQVTGLSELGTLVTNNYNTITGDLSAKLAGYDDRSSVSPQLTDELPLSTPGTPRTESRITLEALKDLIVGAVSGAKYDYILTNFSTNATVTTLYTNSPASDTTSQIKAYVIAGAKTNKGTFELTASVFNDGGTVSLSTNANEHKYFWPTAPNTNALVYWEKNGSDILLQAKGYTNEQFHWLTHINERSATNHTTTTVAADTNSWMTNGLVAAWKLDEPGDGVSNVNREDSGPNAITLTDSTSVDDGVGAFGNGASFVAANSEFLTASTDVAALDFSGGSAVFSVSLWCSVSSQSADRDILNKWGGSGSRTFHLGYLNSSDKLRFILSPDGINGTIIVTAPSTLSTGLVHVYIYYDGPNDVAGMKINNGTLATAAATALSDSGSAWRIGTKASSPQAASGIVDDVRVYNRLLTDAEVTYIAGGGTMLP